MRKGDALSAFLVTGSAPLTRFYQRIGVDQGSLFQEFNRVMAEISGSDPTATTVDVNTARPGGLDLVPLLQGGPALGFMDACGSALARDKADTADYFRQLGRDWVMTDGSGWVQR